MTARARIAAVLGASVLLSSGTALAFSDPPSFDKLPLAAGGGGRFFTGSPADGYTCKVCHSGGEEPKLNITGLPLGGYRPGTRYEVVISWLPQFEKMSLALELTDDKGKLAGEVQLPPEGEVLAPEFCEPAADGVLATSVTEADQRQVVNLPDCGAKRVRFLWTAPTKSVGPVWFSGSAVSSDGQGDTAKDGVTDFGRVLDASKTASETSGQCSVRRPGAHDSALGALAVALTGLLVRVARRRTTRP